MKIKALIVMTMTAAALLLPSCGKQPDKTSDANVNEPVEFGANITVSDSYAFRSLQKRGTFITMLFFITIRYTRYARAS